MNENAERSETRGITVVTTQADGTGDEGEIIAFGPNGEVVRKNSSLRTYFDVDPDPAESKTVIYSGATQLSSDECGADPGCFRVVIERLNITTGETSRLYSRLVPKTGPVRMHDFDRINKTHIVVADIEDDEVSIVNLENEMREWTWSARSDFPPESGGQYAKSGRWTHVNDVEKINDTTYMVSLRNHDQVVFVNTRRGLLENRTLGSDGNHDILYEQHNPDYISSAAGGQSVVVADSENNRIVEYQRANSGWNRTWIWQDVELEWPRDADRLPSGATLITDSHGDRVIEVNENGEIVWGVKAHYPYEAERLGSGDESTGGASANELGYSSRTFTPTVQAASKTSHLDRIVKYMIPNKIIHGLMYITPYWVGVKEFVALFLLLGTAVCWGGAELYFSRFGASMVELRMPIRIRK